MNMNEARLRVALYVRVSSDEPKEGHTTNAQIAVLRQTRDHR